jgi:hypothetical protein
MNLPEKDGAQSKKRRKPEIKGSTGRCPIDPFISGWEAINYFSACPGDGAWRRREHNG